MGRAIAQVAAPRVMTTLGGEAGPLPVPGLSPVFAAQVVMDELMLAFGLIPSDPEPGVRCGRSAVVEWS